MRIGFAVVIAACGSAPAPIANTSTQKPPPAHETTLAEDCRTLYVHLREIEYRKVGAPPPMSAADVQERAEFVTACASMAPSRVRCAIVAQTIEAVAACDR